MTVISQLTLYRSRCQFLCSSLLSSKYLVCSSFQRVFGSSKAKNDEVPIFEYPMASLDGRRVYAWGVAETGALGHYTLKTKRQMKHVATFYHHPRRIYFSQLYKVKDIACGYGFTVYHVEPDLRKSPHKVFGSGVNTDSQIGYHSPNKVGPLALLYNPGPIDIPFKNPKAKVKGLAAGRAHLVVLSDEGVFTLGNNAYGQCGRPVIDGENYAGSRVIHHIPDVHGAQVRTVSCGQDHSMFITDEGKVYACGWNADGQTGQSNFDTHSELREVTGDIHGEDIVKVASSGDCVLAVNSKGQVFGWGNGEYGQFGENILQLSASKHLRHCDHLGKIVDVAAGGSFCMVLNEDGQVFVWGYGILGKGPKAQKSLQPTEIPQTLFGKNEFQPNSKVVGISCGLNHMTAVTNQGDVFSWGHNRGGCLGLGHENDQFFPFRVALGARALKVCCGVDHTVALCLPY